MSNENDDQKAFWERFAEHWVNHQSELDALMAPVLDRVLTHADLKPGQTVLDIGCGTGTSTLLASKSVSPNGSVDGVDISEPMLKRARDNAIGTGNVTFMTADAADYPFPGSHYDIAISRFGVMFFADPIKAFANIRKAMKPKAKITMASWSRLDANPWFQVPMYAAKKRLGAPPPVDPDAPGPLAFRDIERVLGILNAAGFETCDGKSEHLLLTPPGDLAQVAEHAASIGPAARTMEYFEGTQEDFAAIANDVAEAFREYVSENGVCVPAEINFFTATAP
jgi:SAM-dependent methyltransferase